PPAAVKPAAPASEAAHPPAVVLAPPPRPSAPSPEQTITSLAAGVLPPGAKGYTVQAGVFQSSENAEKLLSRLSAAGIPARLETRVQVGPFRNREEADLMMRRLRELGVTPILQGNLP
uniref:SPOR domain-containing protein n=1 Tax=Chitinimonas sp. TaxID=1934313 RepID=UPI0035AE3294